MTTINARGANATINASPNGDITRSYLVTEGGAAKDLTDVSINVKIMDGDTSDAVLATYAQTITNAAGGEFTLLIPKNLFRIRNGEEIYYELILTEDGNDRTWQSGQICIAEAV